MSQIPVFSKLRQDIPASVVVLLVALPLCLGIALGSGAPLFSGIIAGMAGGIIVGVLSGSSLSVSGPAAGLTVIVSGAIQQLGFYEAFLLSVIIAGIFQIVFGYLKAGIIGDYIPNSVIKGMLAAIGLILILKQMPFLLGYDRDFEGDESFVQKDHENTFTELVRAFAYMNPTALVIGGVSLALLLFWEKKVTGKFRYLSLVPAPLMVVLGAVFINGFVIRFKPGYALTGDQLVQLPIASSLSDFGTFFTFPDIKFLTNPQVWLSGMTLAVVASLETLLGIEAVDKLDPLNRITPTNRELKAQGLGNIVSGMLGGLPLTSVVVRSSANVTAGAQTKISAIVHGILMFVCVFFLPHWFNLIPLCALAAILIFTGYKLAKVSLFRDFYQNGWDQFAPFLATILAILFTDLLVGICIGIIVGLFFMIRSNFHSSILMVHDANNFLFRLRKDVSFLNKPIVKRELEKIPDDAYLLIDAGRADFIDKDVVEEINQFIATAHLRNIRVEVKKSLHKPTHLLFIESQKSNTV